MSSKNKVTARENLTHATTEMSQQAVTQLTLVEMRELMDVTGLTVTFIRNEQQSIIAQKAQQELQAAADIIVTRMKGSFPDIAVVPKRNRTLKVWLDGLPEEIE